MDKSITLRVAGTGRTAPVPVPVPDYVVWCRWRPARAGCPVLSPPGQANMSLFVPPPCACGPERLPSHRQSGLLCPHAKSATCQSSPRQALWLQPSQQRARSPFRPRSRCPPVEDRRRARSAPLKAVVMTTSSSKLAGAVERALWPTRTQEQPSRAKEQHRSTFLGGVGLMAYINERQRQGLPGRGRGHGDSGE